MNEILKNLVQSGIRNFDIMFTSNTHMNTPMNTYAGDQIKEYVHSINPDVKV